MRFAKISSAVAAALFGAGATNVAGSWAVTTSCLLVLMAAVVAAIAMEERDATPIEGLAPATDELDAAPVDSALAGAA